MKSESESYRAAGVDITAGYRAVELMKKHVQRTNTPGVLGGLGGFGGLFRPDLAGMAEPVLVSGTDGVGTKLKLAFLMDRHDTVGIDCVAMCVNDVVCCGAQPLFFLDYIACGRNVPERIADIVSGVAEGCVQSGAALIGGETAEMPGFYAENEYDLAIPSRGVHSNGFSLVRRVFDIEHGALERPYQELGRTLGETLLEPTRIYVKPVLAMIKAARVRALSHITGGGFYENIPRSIPQGLCARIQKSALRTPPIFDIISREGAIPERDMYNTFNMGVGMCAVVAKQDTGAALAALAVNGAADAYICGEIARGEGGVELC